MFAQVFWSFVLALFNMGFIYLLGWFISMEADVVVWAEASRFAAVVIWFGMTVMTSLVVSAVYERNQ